MSRNTNMKAMVRGPRKNLKKRNDPARNSSATGSGVVDKVVIPKFIRPNPFRRITKRWVSTAAFAAQTFTQSDLYNQFLVVVATSGNAVPYADMVRIVKLRAYIQGAAGALFTLQPLNADVNNQFASPERTWAIQCQNASAPTQSLVIRPTGPSDPLGGWKESSNVNFAETLFVASWQNGTTGLTIDITFDYIENVVGGPNGYAVLTSTSTLGTVGGRSILSNMNVIGSNQL
jgi:hypothetical protein